MKKLLLIAVLAFVTVSCMSMEDEIRVSRDSALRTDYQSGWYTVITLNNEGTRSEGKTFALFYGRLEIPYLFQSVFAGGQGFRFAVKANLWDSAGYEPSEDVVRVFSKESITTEELSRGFYYSTTWKQGTPEHWMLASRGNVSAVIDPEKLQEFLLQYDWEPFSLDGFKFHIRAPR